MLTIPKTHTSPSLGQMFYRESHEKIQGENVSPKAAGFNYFWESCLINVPKFNRKMVL
jgi:hypothetical protein